MNEGDADRPVFMDVFRGQLAGWLREHGWTVTRRLSRMVTMFPPLAGGPPLLTGPHVYAAAGFELG